MKPFFNRREELSSQDGCILWGSRLVVPQSARTNVLDILHDTHPGMTRMKTLARSFVWWPGIDKAPEEKARGCQECQLHQKNPALAPLHPWIWPNRPWARVHLDYAGPFQGKMFLVTVDAHSKWLDIHTVNVATSSATVAHLRTLFATHGLPETVVTDNGSVFTSQEFEDFMHRNGIHHSRSAPYHPATNGLAERAVQTFRSAVKKQHSGTIETKLARFLFHYRITPHTSTGETPAKLLMGRQLRSHLSLLHPDLEHKVSTAQERQKQTHDKAAHERQLEPGDPVLARNYTGDRKWSQGTILEQTGPVSATVQVGDTVIRRHDDQLQKSTTAHTPESGVHTSVQENSTQDLMAIPKTSSLAPAESGRRYPARECSLPAKFKDLNMS